MCGHAKSHINNVSIRQPSLAVCEIDWNAVIIKDFLIERIDRLVDCLLGCRRLS
jgi:hypothetical protein